MPKLSFVRRFRQRTTKGEGFDVNRSTEAEALAELLLTEAYEFVLSGWCQGAQAVDECGRSIEPASAFARRWSVLGALERAWRRSPAPADTALLAFESAKRALTAAVNDVPQAWNDGDGRRHSEVLDALAEAVQLVTAADAQRPDLVADLVDDLDRVPPRWAPDVEIPATMPAPAETLET
jgi:hypothetical protein